MKGLVPISYGWMPSVFTATTTSALNAAGARVGPSFVPSVSKTLSKLLVRVSAVSGTLGASDCVCDLYSDTATGANTGKPNTSIESRATVTTTPTGAAWIEFTGFTTALTAGTRYWFVLKNANGTPATNNFTLLIMRAIYDGLASGLTTLSQSYTVSADSGSTWTNTAGGFAFRVEYSDGSFDGFPLESGPAGGATEAVYDTREYGGTFQTPANGKLRVVGFFMGMAKAGTPTFTLEARLRNASRTLLATSAVLPAEALTTTNAMVPILLATPFELDASTVYSVSLGVTGSSGGSSSNYVRGTYYTLQNSAGSKSLMPFNGTLQQVYFDGSTWTATDTRVVTLKLLLDFDNEIAAVSSGSAGAGLSRVQLGM